MECALCALNIVFPFNGFGWHTGDGVGTFVLGLLSVSWVGWDVYDIYVCAYSYVSQFLLLPCSLSRYHPQQAGGAVLNDQEPRRALGVSCSGMLIARVASRKRDGV